MLSGAGCAARVSPAGAKVVAEKTERNGGKSACVASACARNESEEASVVESRDFRKWLRELTDTGFAISGEACGSKIHWPASLTGDESFGRMRSERRQALRCGIGNVQERDCVESASRERPAEFGQILRQIGSFGARKNRHGIVQRHKQQRTRNLFCL